MRKGSCICPCCGKDMAPHAIHGHTKQCSSWIERYGEPYPKFKYSLTLAKYLPDLVEGVDYLSCRVCLEYGWDFRFKRLIQHLEAHNTTEHEYITKYLEAKVRLDSTLARREATVQDRFGVRNVFQSENIKSKANETMIQIYGAANPQQSEQLRNKTAATNLERYGSENPFGSDEIKIKLRETCKERYGSEFPNQNPEQYAKIEATNLQKYGDKIFYRTVAFKEKFKAASLKRFGTEHPMQSDEGKTLCAEGCLQIYGVTSPLLLPSVQKKSYDTSVRNHDGVHHLSHPDIIAKRKENMLALYGVDNISKVPEIKEKIVSILKSRWNRAVPVQNKLEKLVQGWLPETCIYVGDWTYWVNWTTGRRKNPDFVCLTQEQLETYKASGKIPRVSKVIEVNGDFWHTKFIGMTREDREEQFIQEYKAIGIDCLVVWGSLTVIN